MPSSFDVVLRVNGRVNVLALPAEALLLDVLRDRLGLKGAKRSCDSQVCGACTVLVDGAAVSACTYLAVEASGRDVQTVEGLAPEAELSPVQRAFVERGAVQCGFCTAGLLMTAQALAAGPTAPTRESVLHALRGSLCRCTGYQRIVEAILAGAAGSRGSAAEAPPDGAAALRVVGHSVPRGDADNQIADGVDRNL